MQYTQENRPTRLCRWDSVIFNVNGQGLRYQVNDDFLNCTDGDNDLVFKKLGFGRDKTRAFCTSAYGYPDGGGSWPQCREDDFKALTRLVNAIFDQILDGTDARVSARAMCKAKLSNLLDSFALGPVMGPADEFLPYIKMLQGMKYYSKDSEGVRHTHQLVKRVRGGGFTATDLNHIKALKAKVNIEPVDVEYR